MIWSVPFWKATAERVLSTFLFAFLAAAGLGGAPTTMETVPWLAAVNIGAAAAVGSLVKCMLVALPDGNPGAGSFESVTDYGEIAGYGVLRTPLLTTPSWPFILGCLLLAIAVAVIAGFAWGGFSRKVAIQSSIVQA